MPLIWSRVAKWDYLTLFWLPKLDVRTSEGTTSMKKLLILSALLLSQLAHADDKFQLLCTTEFLTTSFVIRDIDPNITVVEVFNHNGTAFMPIFDGVATPTDLSTLTARAKTLTDLGSYLRFEWPKDKCKKTDDLVEECFGSTELQDINGHKVKAWAFDSSYVTEKSMAGKFNSYKLVLNLEIDGDTYAVPMRYADTECTDQATMTNPVLKKMNKSKSTH